MALLLAISYIPCATSSKEKTGYIITFTQFEEEDLLYKTRDNSGRGDKSDDNSIVPPLISEEEMDVMDSGD